MVCLVSHKSEETSREFGAPEFTISRAMLGAYDKTRCSRV
jgi:hypothetical protein